MTRFFVNLSARSLGGSCLIEPLVERHGALQMRGSLLSAVLCAAACASVVSAATCTRPVDLVMILDESGSVSNAEWSEAKTFMGQIAARYNVGQGADQTRISIVPFSGDEQNVGVLNKITFKDGTSNAAMQSLISGMSRTYTQGTCTGKAMKFTTDNVIATATTGTAIANGYRNKVGGVSTAVVFLTDGNPSRCANNHSARALTRALQC